MRGLIATALAALLLQAGAARASDAEDAFKSANQALADAVHRAADEKREPPRLADPAQAPQIRAAFDERVLTPVDESNAERAPELCEAAGGSLQAYLFFGAEAKDYSRVDVISANSLRFQDEVTQAMAFSIACAERMVRAADMFWEKLPDAERTDVRRGGVAKMRAGVAEMYRGAIVSQRDPISAANRVSLLDAAVAHMDFFASVLDPGDRESVIGEIDATLADKTVGEDTKAKLQRIRGAMARKDCTGFCAV